MNIQIEFTPDAATKPWASVEVEGVAYEDGRSETDIQRVEEGEKPDFYSVYLRLLDGRAFCVADLPTKFLAEELASLLMNAAKNYFPA